MACNSLISFALLGLFVFSFVEAQPNGGLTVELIHRDSQKSPFYNPSDMHSQRLTNALRRSINRLNRLYPSHRFPSSSPPQSQIISNRGEYLIKISIGTPPVEILGIADTGSDLIWTQCSPCRKCYKQSTPLFDPKKSSTYKSISCSSKRCPENLSSCSLKAPQCAYQITYGDSSFSSGNIASDVVTLGSTAGNSVAFNDTVFGCGFRNDGTFGEEGSGIIGLGAGKESLISQMGASANGKFSYCLVPAFSETSNSSKISFGDRAVPSGAGVASTPLITKAPDTYYFLNLKAISVGNKRIEFQNSDLQPNSDFVPSEGNIVIDSGTTLTLLPEAFYEKVEKAVVNQIKLTRVEDPEKVLSLCYQTKSEIAAPTVIAHFAGADVELKSINTFVRLSDDLVCFAFSPIRGGSASFGIFGNLAQLNYLVAYDLKGKTVSFKPTDCSKQ